MTPRGESTVVSHRVVSSFLWLNGERVGRLAVGVIQTAIVARHLGPTWFGELNGSIAFVVLFAAFCTLGLDSIVARRLSLAPRQAGVILGTAVAARLASGSLLTLTLVGIGAAGPSAGVRVIVAFTAVAQSLQIGEAWFASTGKQRKAATVRLGVFLAAFLVRMALAAGGASVLYFAAMIVLETTASGLITLIWAKREAGMSLSFSWSPGAQELLRESWPIIVSMIGVAVCTRVDLVLVSRLIPGDVTGAYAAAVRVNEMLQFIATAIPAATVGLLVRLHHRDPRRFREVQGALTGLAAWTGLLIAASFVLTGPFIIQLIFGADYAAAGSLLRVLAWSNVAVFAGSAWSVFWLAHEQQRALMYITVTSAVVTLGLSLLLIAEFGAAGAAWAVVVGQLVPFILLQRHSEARAGFVDMVRSATHPLQSTRLIAEWLRDSLNDDFK